MTGKSVLAIGIDPALADLSAHPEFPPDLVRAYIDGEIERTRSLGYEIDLCLIDRGETAERTVENALRSRDYDCIVLGAGVREPAELLLLFEKIINLVHRLAPNARIAFNSNPADTAEAVQRWLG